VSGSQRHATQALERSRRQVLGEILARSARRRPDKPALVFEGESRTFAELDRRVNQLANAMAARGVEPGGKVAILMQNGLEVVESYLACAKLGAWAVPLNFRLAPAEVAHIVQDSDSCAMLSDAPLAAVAAAAASDLRFHLSTACDLPDRAEGYEEALGAASADAPDVVVKETDVAFLMYTSGTTGLPKGAMITHQNLVANTLHWVVEVQAASEDVWLSGTPLFHVGALSGVLPFLYLGATDVILPVGAFDPARAFELMREWSVTMCYFVPSQWQLICTSPAVKSVDVAALRKTIWGAAPASRETLELMAASFPNAETIAAFGQTEMSPNTAYLKGADALRKIGSVGKPALGVEARIVDDAGRDVPQGDVGEIVYRGPTVMLGYYKNPEATAEAFRDGWFHSGDLVRADEDGFLYVVDRKKDMIISGGENIYPAELERVLQSHPAVAEVAVVGVPHPKWGETPVAVVATVPGGQAGEDELIDLCRRRLASYKKPSAVVFRDELPRNATGKLLKRTLRDELRAR
jgi:fatty-acyl-CoA synthase